MGSPTLTEAAAPPVLYRPEDAARQLGVSRAQMFQMLASGAITSVKIGRLRRVPHTALVAYVERLEAEQAVPASA